MNSWKTTVFGLMASIGAAVAAGIQQGVINAHDLPHWVGSVAALLSVIGIAGLGFNARDNDKTSEQVGAGKPAGGPPTVLLLIIAVLLYGTAISMMVSGCVGGPQRIAYNVESTAQVTVETAMGAWGDYVKQYHPPAAQEQQVADAYKHYQDAMTAVIDATQVYVALAANASTNAPNADTQRQLAAHQAAVALADLVALVRNFGVKL
jgi:hypothetical protein